MGKTPSDNIVEDLRRHRTPEKRVEVSLSEVRDETGMEW